MSNNLPHNLSRSVASGLPRAIGRWLSFSPRSLTFLIWSKNAAIAFTACVGFLVRMTLELDPASPRSRSHERPRRPCHT